jgi:PAS domain S-box-containing protein
MATGSPSGSGRLRIGFAICDPGLSFGAIVRLGANERAAELGVDLSVISVFTPQEQAAVIESFVRHGVDALIVEALESRIVLPALNRAAAARIPIVVADMGISDAQAVCTVRSDNVKGGELAAAYLVERLGGSGTIAHLRGMPTSENGLDRTRGMHNILDRHPGIEIVFEGTCEWTREAGTVVMGEVLARHRSLGAVFGGNDPLALGAMDAIARAGRTDEIIVVGFDALPDALLAIEQGTMGATVRQAPRSIGRLAVETAVKAARGEAVPPIVQTEVALVTSGEVADASLAALPLFPRVLRDLTESLDALAEERSLLRTLIDNLPDLIYVKDQASRFVLVNPGLMRLVGARTPEEVIGRTDFDFFPPELATQYYTDEQAIIATGEPLISHEERSVDASGEVRWFSSTKVLARDESGAFVGLVGMNRDITERRRLEAQLLHVQKMETVGQLAGGIAHDFNNLLTVIVGCADLLLARTAGDIGIREDLLEIKRAGMRGAMLAQQLLAFARKQVLEPRVVDLGALVTELEKLLRRLIGEQIEIVTVGTREKLNVRVDPGQIEQVLVNLAINARDAMPHGGTLTIRSASVRLAEDNPGVPVHVEPGDYALVSVQDTGSGMALDVLSRAFEPFFTTKEVGRGTGLGLAMSLGVVEQHGGYIWAESEVGRGTTVSFCLPGVGAHEAEPIARQDPSAVLAGTETILLVEDEPAARRLATRVLRKHGYTVIEAGNGEEALAIASEWPQAIDLLLTDVVMPRMGGVAVSDRLTSARPYVKVLYMSGYAHSAIAQRGRLEERIPLLTKPFTPDELLRHVRQALDSDETDQFEGSA